MLEERLVILEKMVQNEDNASRFQALDYVVQNMCRVVDAVMKKIVMATISRQGKIKKQQRKREYKDEADLLEKMEVKNSVDDIFEDLIKAWSLIEDA